MRICPTNVIQPAGIDAGLEGLWTPILNNRIGSSGCQLNCVACSQVCPTAAIRPITLAEKLGVGEFAEKGPIKLGTAFVDRNRCLPWAMDKPCIVCQENCPVSPKAIFTREEFVTIRNGTHRVKEYSSGKIELTESNLSANKFDTGDYYCLSDNGRRFQISWNTENFIEILDAGRNPFTEAKTAEIQIQVRLQRPYIDIEKCIGCGVCEHECPVSGIKAIRVSGEGQTRDPRRRLIAQS